MPNKTPSKSAPSYSANDNGPLTAGQVKVLKWSIAIMGVMIVAALLAIVGRVIYLASAKKPVKTQAQSIAKLAPQHTLALPQGATLKRVSLQGNRMLIHYETPSGHGAIVLDLASGQSLSQVTIRTGVPEKP